MRKTGIYKKCGDFSHFIPYPLPPSNPPLELNAEIMKLYGQASFAFGQLNEISQNLPDTQRFIKAYVIKEALMSSAIEGIHTTLIEAFSAQLGEFKASKDTQLVINYTDALNAALKMVVQDGLPIVSRVILKAHEVLLSGGVGEKANPGQYRKQTVRVGDLIPPPAGEIPGLMHDLEKYINEFHEAPSLIKAGLAHLQFETIHPFLDGNGRIGRLLIVLMLIDSGLLKSPILYPSYYFKKHHVQYYAHLDRVRTHGDFEGWMTYYLTSMRDSALDAYKRARDIETFEATIKKLIASDPTFSKMRDTALAALEYLFSQPITTIVQMSKDLNRAYNTIQNILKTFMGHELVIKDTEYTRNKLYRFESYLAILEKEY